MDDRIHRINENLQVGGIIRLGITLNDHFSTVGTFCMALTLLLVNGTGAIKMWKNASFWDIKFRQPLWAHTSKNVILGLWSLLSIKFCFAIMMNMYGKFRCL